MAEKVFVKGGGTLDGAQFDNAATEETLKNLIKAVEKLKPGSGAAVNSIAEKSQGIQPSIVKETNNSINAVGDAAKKAAGGIGSMAADTTKFLASGAFALLGSGLLFLKDTIYQSMDTLRNTAKNGASFNGSLLELNRSAAMSGMNLDKYSEFIKQNKTTMAMFGGTVTEGAKRMGEMAKDIRKSDVGEQLQALGVSTDDINNGMAQYVAQQSAAGRLQGKSQAEITKGAGEYLKNLGELSRLTGESVDALAAKQNEEQREARTAIATANMSEEAKKTFTDSMVFTAASNKDFANSFKNSISGIPDETAEFMMANNKEYADAVRKVQRGEAVSREEMAAAMAGNATLFDKLAKSTNGQALANNAAILGLAKMQGDMNDVRNKVAAGGLQAAADEGKKSAAFTKSVMTFDNTVNDIIGQIKKAIIDSDVFKMLGDAVEWVGKKFLEFKPMIMDFFNNISGYLKPSMDILGAAVSSVAMVFDQMLMPIAKALWSDISTLATVIYNFVKPAFDSIGGAFTSLLPSMDDTIKVFREWEPVIVGLVEAFAVYKGVTIAASLAKSAFTAITLTSVGALGTLLAPVLATAAVVTSLAILFKSLYDSGWTFNTVLEGVGDTLTRFGIYLMEVIDKAMGALPSMMGGYSDAMVKEKAALRKAQKDELDAKEKARDEKRAQIRTDRGTQDSAFNLSGAGAAGPPTPGSPAAKALEEEAKKNQKKIAEEMAAAAPRAPAVMTPQQVAAISTPTASAPLPPTAGQSLANTTPNINALVNQTKPGSAVGFAPNEMAEYLIANPKFAAAQEAAVNQIATLNTMNDGITKLTTIMASILELQHQQVDAQKDLVNVTKGKYNAVG
jgi:hypothetical protein